LAEILPDPSAAFFQNFFDNGSVPQKLSIISLIYKNRDRSDPLNYRPVTLLPVFSKIMETVVAQELMNHLERRGHIFSSQHGFRPGCLCTTNLLSAQTDWISSVDAGLGIAVQYLDVSKAFDWVRYDILIEQLFSYNVKWIVHIGVTFLQYQRISVRVHGELQ